MVESICARDALSACENNLWSLYYWRDKGIEVDLVLDRKIDILPIEVKYRSDVNKTGLSVFRQKFNGANIPLSIVVTKDQLNRKQDTLFIPFWLVH